MKESENVGCVKILSPEKMAEIKCKDDSPIISIIDIAIARFTPFWFTVSGWLLLIAGYRVMFGLTENFIFLFLDYFSFGILAIYLITVFGWTMPQVTSVIFEKKSVPTWVNLLGCIVAGFWGIVCFQVIEILVETLADAKA